VQAKRLGAESVTLVYRRGPEAMSATHHEQSFAKENGVTIRHWAAPKRLEGEAGSVARAVFEYTALKNGKLTGTGEEFSLAADMVFKAIGQIFLPDPVMGANGAALLELKDGRIKAGESGKTSLDKVWAGGDCVAGGQDLTVAAVQAGKLAAIDIDRHLQALKQAA